MCVRFVSAGSLGCGEMGEMNNRKKQSVQHEQISDRVDFRGAIFSHSMSYDSPHFICFNSPDSSNNNSNPGTENVNIDTSADDVSLF